jgi:hypothetical protein
LIFESVTSHLKRDVRYIMKFPDTCYTKTELQDEFRRFREISAIDALEAFENGADLEPIFSFYNSLPEIYKLMFWINNTSHHAAGSLSILVRYILLKSVGFTYGHRTQGFFVFESIFDLIGYLENLKNNHKYNILEDNRYKVESLEEVDTPYNYSPYKAADTSVYKVIPKRKIELNNANFTLYGNKLCLAVLDQGFFGKLATAENAHQRFDLIKQHRILKRCEFLMLWLCLPFSYEVRLLLYLPDHLLHSLLPSLLCEVLFGECVEVNKLIQILSNIITDDVRQAAWISAKHCSRTVTLGKSKVSTYHLSSYKHFLERKLNLVMKENAHHRNMLLKSLLFEGLNPAKFVPVQNPVEATDNLRLDPVRRRDARRKSTVLELSLSQFPMARALTNEEVHEIELDKILDEALGIQEPSDEALLLHDFDKLKLDALHERLKAGQSATILKDVVKHLLKKKLTNDEVVKKILSDREMNIEFEDELKFVGSTENNAIKLDHNQLDSLEDKEKLEHLLEVKKSTLLKNATEDLPSTLSHHPTNPQSEDRGLGVAKIAIKQGSQSDSNGSSRGPKIPLLNLENIDNLSKENHKILGRKSSVKHVERRDWGEAAIKEENLKNIEDFPKNEYVSQKVKYFAALGMIHAAPSPQNWGHIPKMQTASTRNIISRQ